MAQAPNGTQNGTSEQHRWPESEWYVVADVNEIAEGLLARTVLDRNVVLFRDADGNPVMLDDQCPHRAVQLSLGTVTPKGLQCGYHGFTFDREGRCTLAPGNDPIPAQAKVHSYPLIEQQGWLFAWMGSGPAQTDHPHLHAFTSRFRDDFTWTERRYLPIAADPQLAADNLLDLSHIDYVHMSVVGEGTALVNSQVEVVVEGDVVKQRRTSLNQPVFPFFASKLPPLINEAGENQWAPPGNLTISAEFYDPAQGQGSGIQTMIQIALTPASAGTCHYFWQSGVNAVHADVLPVQDMATVTAFNQDVAFFESQQRQLAGTDIESVRLAGSKHDHGLQRARTIMRRLRAEEAAARTAAPATAPA